MTPEMAADVTIIIIAVVVLICGFVGVGHWLGKRSGHRASRLSDWHYPRIDLDGNRDTSRALCNPSPATEQVKIIPQPILTVFVTCQSCVKLRNLKVNGPFMQQTVLNKRFTSLDEAMHWGEGEHRN